MNRALSHLGKSYSLRKIKPKVTGTPVSSSDLSDVNVFDDSLDEENCKDTKEGIEAKKNNFRGSSEDEDREDDNRLKTALGLVNEAVKDSEDSNPDPTELTDPGVNEAKKQPGPGVRRGLVRMFHLISKSPAYSVRNRSLL